MGTRTVEQVAAAARSLLQDSNNAPTGGYRYSDNEVALAITDAIAEARRLRPDLFLAFGLDTALPLHTTAAGNTTVLPVADTYFVPIVNHVVGRLSLREDEFSNDGRAVTLTQLFSAALTSNGGKP